MSAILLAALRVSEESAATEGRPGRIISLFLSPSGFRRAGITGRQKARRHSRRMKRSARSSTSSVCTAPERPPITASKTEYGMVKIHLLKNESGEVKEAQIPYMKIMAALHFLPDEIFVFRQPVRQIRQIVNRSGCARDGDAVFGSANIIEHVNIIAGKII